MDGKIFINYRRADSIAVAGRLRDRFAEIFGRDKVFMDVDDIPIGFDFVDDLEKQVAACDAMLSIVGPNWLDAKDMAGQLRLGNPGDYVTIEIKEALARNTPVIPVLVDGTPMPTMEQLPDPLKPFARRNAFPLRNTNFGSDADALIKKMGEALGGELGAPPSKRQLDNYTMPLSAFETLTKISGWFLRQGTIWLSILKDPKEYIARIDIDSSKAFGDSIQRGHDLALKPIRRDKSNYYHRGAGVGGSFV
jgi:hypothetical protein